MPKLTDWMTKYLADHPELDLPDPED